MHTTKKLKGTSNEPAPSTILEKIHFQTYKELLSRVDEAL